MPTKTLEVQLQEAQPAKERAKAVSIGVAVFMMGVNITAAYANCDAPMLTKAAVHDLCNKADSNGVARLVITDRSCGMSELREIALARKASYGYGFKALSNLIKAIYSPDTGFITLQSAQDSVCWGINYPK